MPKGRLFFEDLKLKLFSIIDMKIKSGGAFGGRTSGISTLIAKVLNLAVSAVPMAEESR